MSERQVYGYCAIVRRYIVGEREHSVSQLDGKTKYSTKKARLALGVSGSAGRTKLAVVT